MQGKKINWITKKMASYKGSFQIVYQGRTVFHSFYDGEKGYELVQGKKQLADQQEFSDKKFRKNIINELDYLDPTLYTLALDGSEKVAKEDFYKVKDHLHKWCYKIIIVKELTYNYVKIKPHQKKAILAPAT